MNKQEVLEIVKNSQAGHIAEEFIGGVEEMVTKITIHSETMFMVDVEDVGSYVFVKQRNKWAIAWCEA